MNSKYEKLKERIKNNELLGYEYVEKFKDNLPGMLLFFKEDSRMHTIAHEGLEEIKDLVKDLELRFRTFSKSFYGIEY